MVARYHILNDLDYAEHLVPNRTRFEYVIHALPRESADHVCRLRMGYQSGGSSRFVSTIPEVYETVAGWRSKMTRRHETDTWGSCGSPTGPPTPANTAIVLDDDLRERVSVPRLFGEMTLDAFGSEGGV